MGECPFHKTVALPVLAVDEQIYRRLPCFLISTIDKFAALPWVGKTSSLFGNVTHYHLQTGSGVAGFWGPAEKANGIKIPQGRLLPPELVIGSVFKTVTYSSGQSGEQHFVVLANGVARVNDTTAAALRATNSYGLISPPSIEPSAVARVAEQVYG